MLILIPAYQPDLRLVGLVRTLRAQAPDAGLLIIDDGSGPGYDGVFTVAAATGAEVVRYPTNHGKGAALKLGFAWAAEHRPGAAVVCADSDGQHTVTDILRVAAAIVPGAMVLGGREFTGRVPVRSRLGNTVSRWAFRAATGLAIHDTQTGLRGYGPDLLDWLVTVGGERFEYESNLLFEARRAGVRVVEIPIETIYHDENASSHFRPVRDSLRIYSRLLAFAGSSLICAGVDWVGVLALQASTGNLLLSVVAARLASASLNFGLNRTAVFGDDGDLLRAARRYGLLALGVLAANYTLLRLLVGLGSPLVAAKLVTETALFLAGYLVQRRLIFRGSAVAANDPESVAVRS